MKSFQFSPRPPHEAFIEINDVKIPLETKDITGMDILEGMAANAIGAPAGVHRFLAKVVPDEQWERFNQLTAGATPSQVVEISGAIAEALATFPTTTEEPISSNGDSNTGNTPE